jgi:hypothetical protein
MYNQLMLVSAQKWKIVVVGVMKEDCIVNGHIHVINQNQFQDVAIMNFIITQTKLIVLAVNLDIICQDSTNVKKIQKKVKLVMLKIVVIILIKKLKLVFLEVIQTIQVR